MDEGALNKENIVSLGGSQEEVREKQLLRMQLDEAYSALMLAYNHRGDGANQPSEKDLGDFRNAANEIEKMKKELLSRPIAEEDKMRVHDWCMFVKVGLVAFLSDAQYVEIFGADNLA